MKLLLNVAQGLALVVVAAVSPESAFAAVSRDTLPCDSYLLALAAGPVTSAEMEVHHLVDGCDRPDSVVLSARRQGITALAGRDEPLALLVAVSYARRDENWWSTQRVSLLLPLAQDKSKSLRVRQAVLIALTVELNPAIAPDRDSYFGSGVVNVETAMKCSAGSTSRGGVPLESSERNVVLSSLQQILHDPTESIHLRRAVGCVLANSM